MLVPYVEMPCESYTVKQLFKYSTHMKGMEVILAQISGCYRYYDRNHIVTIMMTQSYYSPKHVLHQVIPSLV
jgi:hypothetical protein